MSKRVANLIESIMGSAAAGQTVAETAKATYAPTTVPSATASSGKDEEESALDKAAKGVISQALKQGKAKKK